MVFSDAVNDSGIVQDINDWCGTDDTSYPIAKKTRDINAWLDRVVSLILQSDGRWQWDDSNYTDLPIGTGNLVSGQQDYNIAGSTFLNLSRLEVMGTDGCYHLVEPIDEHDIQSQALSEYMKTPGMPLKYDKKGDSVFLYPVPSSDKVTLVKGLKVSFQRVGSYFTSADTTKSPGFNPLFHRILSLGPSLDYVSKNELVTKVKIISPMVDKLEAGLILAYATRSKDEKTTLKLRKESYGVGGYHPSDRQI